MKILLPVFAFLLLILLIDAAIIRQTSASSSPWVQTDWSGGDYTAMSNLDTTTAAGQLTLAGDPSGMSLVGTSLGTEETAAGLVELNGNLYIAMHTNPKNGTKGTIVSYNDTTGEFKNVHTMPGGSPASQGIGSIEVLNSTIFVPSIDCAGSYGNCQIDYSTDGANWQTSNIVKNSPPPGIIGLFDMVYYNSRYYVTAYTQENYKGQNWGVMVLLSSPNGTSDWTESYGFRSPLRPSGDFNGRFVRMAVFNNKMYFAPQYSNAGGVMRIGEDLFSFDGADWTPIEFTNSTPIEITDMKVFEGKLFLSNWMNNAGGSVNTPALYATTDGKTFSAVPYFTSASRKPALLSLFVYNRKLYAAEDTLSSGTVTIYQTADGDNWSQATTVPASDTAAGDGADLTWNRHPAFGTYKGRLYLVAPGNVPKAVQGIPSADAAKLYVSGYFTQGSVISNVFDTGQSSNWGAVSWTSDMPDKTSVVVKARTSDNADMRGAKDFSSCDAILSGADISGKTCVTDGQRYIQYQAVLSTQNGSVTPVLKDISIAYSGLSAQPSSSPSQSASDQGNSAGGGNISTAKQKAATPGSPQISTPVSVKSGKNIEIAGIKGQAFPQSNIFTFIKDAAVKIISLPMAVASFIKERFILVFGFR